MASKTAAQCEGNWVRLKFLPLEWAVDTMVGSAQIAELLKTSCGLECRRIDIMHGYRHQQGGLGPMYAYAYIQVEHQEVPLRWSAGCRSSCYKEQEYGPP